MVDHNVADVRLTVSEPETKRSAYLRDEPVKPTLKVHVDETLGKPHIEESGRIMVWSPQHVENIRRTYVDDAAVVVALARRIGSSTVKQPVKNIVSAGASD